MEGEEEEEKEGEEEEDSGKWCYCNENKGGRMIACDNLSCKIKWFHMVCLRMDNEPKGKWVCPTCHRTPKENRN